jgi:hypothetical protein
MPFFREPHLRSLLRLPVKVAVSCIVFFGLSGFIRDGSAQDLPLALDMPLPGVTAYDAAVPRPEAVVGHVIGTRHTLPHEIVDYFQAVDAASDRVVLAEHGRTYEGRPLIHAIVTSPQNHARLDAIREANRQLSDAPGDVSDAALRTMPAVAYMGYSIHGNEASGSEAAVLLLYHLAAGAGPAVERVLDEVVVLIDPMFNPDGRDRFTDWVNRNRGAVPVADPQGREHNEPWPGGRTNHYWFDLNRDWLPAVHPESQGRLALFHAWRPQVLTDYHEMGSEATYFFQPGIPSRNNPNTPAGTFELTAELAAYHARWLERIGSLYYTEETFDDFYYGKGSTYPDINGAVGILFEQASSRALARETSTGVLDYAFTVRNQFSASLSTLEAITNLRERLLQHQRDFYAEVPRLAAADPVKGYVIGTARGGSRAQALVDLLLRHRVRVYELARRVEAGDQAFEPGEALIIPADQPQGRLVEAVMERTTTFRDSLFYDVSSWTLPLAFDLDHAELRQDVAPLRGAEVTTTEALQRGQVVGRSSYAYVMEWGPYYAPRALYRLLDAGVHARLVTKPFSAVTGGQARTFGRGSIIVPVLQQDTDAEEVHRLVSQAAAEDGVTIYAVDSGLTPEGPDLGGPGTSLIPKPEVALLTGPGTSAYDAGEVWHLLSERFHMPVTLLDVDDVESADLARYNTLVLAGGAYGSLPADEVKAWVRSGGRLVAIGSAAGWLQEHALTELEEKPFDLDSLLQGLPYDQVSNARDAQQIGGTIFRARLDETHPLAYGYAETVPVFRDSGTFYEPSEEPGTNVAVYTEDPLVSGYASAQKRALAGGSAALVARRYGRGRVILFLDNPNFRGFWYGTNGLFLNALFFGGAF